MIRHGVATLALVAVACGGAHGSPPDAASDSATYDAADAPDGASDASEVQGATEAEAGDAPKGDDANGALPCPLEMVRIDTFCIDRYEDSVLVVGADGAVSPHPPNETVSGLTLVARSAGNVFPQAYISQVQAARACANAGKRLCARDEFVKACRGPSDDDLYPYGGSDKKPGACNEGKGSAIFPMFGSDPNKWTYGDFNDPRLNAPPATNLARTGAHARCVSPYGVYDLVGNLHEWGSDSMDAYGRGRFRGGFYGDAEVNGHGCLYVTKAHEPTYHDYSTGFRCCMDAPGEEPKTDGLESLDAP